MWFLTQLTFIIINSAKDYLVFVVALSKKFFLSCYRSLWSFNFHYSLKYEIYNSLKLSQNRLDSLFCTNLLKRENWFLMYYYTFHNLLTFSFCLETAITTTHKIFIGFCLQLLRNLQILLFMKFLSIFLPSNPNLDHTTSCYSMGLNIKLCLILCSFL